MLYELQNVDSIGQSVLKFSKTKVSKIDLVIYVKKVCGNILETKNNSTIEKLSVSG